MSLSTPVVYVSSRDNPLVKDLRQLSRSGSAYRKMGQLWLEGDHLCRAALARGVVPTAAVFLASYWPQATALETGSALKNVVVADALWPDISGLESPAPMGFVVALPGAVALQPLAASVILDRVQDAGNVGSILRSAAAFGFGQIIALKGTAALWSPKVLRAGMGAHFGLHLLEGVDIQALTELRVPIVVTSSHQGFALHRQTLPMPCAWALGHEGQGVGQQLQDRAAISVRIDQPGGEESLNVAAAAAICLYTSSVNSLH